MGRRSLLLVATLSIGTAQGCGSNAASSVDGATGADAVVRTDDAAVPVFSCPEVPCLATAASVTAACKPNNTCTNQVTISGTTTTMNRCFSNGVNVQELGLGATASNPGGQVIMSVKKGGALCYSLEIDYEDAGRTTGNLVYKDAGGATMVTLFADDSANPVTATCPGGSAVAIPSSGACAEAFGGLGGVLPFTSCFTVTQGTCAF
jgi:hypothetical protein